MALPTLPNYAITGPHLISGDSLNKIVAWLRGALSVLTTDDGGTTQTLTAAMVSNNGAAEVYHPSTGGSTPSLTLPLASAVLANLPDAVVGTSYYLRFINNNSGTATIVTNTGWTLTGTLTLATNTTRDFIVTVGAGNTLTAVCVGTGTMS
jgi:hypothetical protein